MAPTTDFTPVQEQHLEDMIGRVFRGMLESTVPPQGPPGLPAYGP